MRAFLIGAAALWFAACGPEGFEKRVAEGSYQGFTIGSTGPQAYEVFRLRPERNGYRTVSCGGFDPDGTRIATAGDSYGLWNQWVVRRSLGPDSTDRGLSLWFEHDTLRHANVWGIGRPADLVTGMGWDSVLSLVKRVARDSLGDSLDIDLDEKNFEKDYDLCLVDSAFGPWTWVGGEIPGRNPVEPVTMAAGWHLSLSAPQGCAEGMTLYFRGDTLFQIHHARTCTGWSI
jgi:hypothetical protein